MPDQQIFFDPERKRWKRLRRFLDLAAVATTLVLVGFIFNVLRNQRLPELLLPLPRHNYRALPDQSILLRIRNQRLEHRKTKRKPSDIPLNTGEGLRAAYYVQDDTASYSSLKEHIHQIDMLFPQWLHVDSPNGTLMMMSGDNLRELPVIEGAAIHDPDYLNKVKHVIQAAKEDTEVFPAINNFNPHTQEWDTGVGDVLNDPSKSAAFREQLMRFLIAYPAYRGLSLDIESIPDEDEPAYLSFIQALYSEMHARNLRLWVNVAAGDSDSDFKSIAANSDGIVLMNYDEHQTTSDPGPVAAQPWFVANLVRVLKDVPKKKIICGLGNYGYDWTLSIPNPKDRHHRKPQVLNTDNLSVSDAWELASDADADLDLDYDTLNPHFEYIDEDKNQRHVVWFLDGVTLLNEMRAARQLGLETFALWRLGEEDSSLWNVWDHPSDPASLQALGTVQPGHDVDTEGDGDILRVTGLPQPGKRTVEVDTDEPDPRKKLIVDEHMDVYPRTYTVQQYGYHPNEACALPFDDGPDPKWTPKILDILKRKHVKGHFHAHRLSRPRTTWASCSASSAKATRSAITPGPIPTSAKSRRANWIWKSTSLSASSKASWACSLSTSARPTISTRNPIPTTRPRPCGAFSRTASPLSAARSIPTTGTSIHARRRPEIIQSVLAQLQTMNIKPQFRGSIILAPRRRRRPLGHGGSSGAAYRRPACSRLRHRSGLRVDGQDRRAGHAPAYLLAARAHHSRFHRLFRARHHRQLHRHGLLRRRHSHERAAHHCRFVRRHRPLYKATQTNFGWFQPARGGSHPRL